MRRALTIVGAALVLGCGVTAAVALGAGTGSKDGSTSTSTGTSTAPTKVWLCHRTGSWKHPYHLIHVSSHAAAAHLGHGDVMPGSGNSCPSTQPPGAKQHGGGQGEKGKSDEKDDNEAAEKDD
jgi:hypothetical protein